MKRTQRVGLAVFASSTIAFVAVGFFAPTSQVTQQESRAPRGTARVIWTERMQLESSKLNQRWQTMGAVQHELRTGTTVLLDWQKTAAAESRLELQLPKVERISSALGLPLSSRYRHVLPRRADFFWSRDGGFFALRTVPLFGNWNGAAPPTMFQDVIDFKTGRRLNFAAGSMVSWQQAQKTQDQVLALMNRHGGIVLAQWAPPRRLSRYEARRHAF